MENSRQHILFCAIFLQIKTHNFSSLLFAQTIATYTQTIAIHAALLCHSLWQIFVCVFSFMFFSSSVLSRAYCVYLLLLFNSIFNVYSRRMDSFRNTKTTTTVYKYMKASFVLIHFFVFLSFHFSPSIFFSYTQSRALFLARSLALYRPLCLTRFSFILFCVFGCCFVPLWENHALNPTNHYWMEVWFLFCVLAVALLSCSFWRFVSLYVCFVRSILGAGGGWQVWMLCGCTDW